MLEKKIKDIRLGKSISKPKLDLWLKNIYKGKTREGKWYYRGIIVKNYPYDKPDYEFWGRFNIYAKNKSDLIKIMKKRLKKQGDL